MTTVRHREPNGKCRKCCKKHWVKKGKEKVGRIIGEGEWKIELDGGSR